MGKQDMTRVLCAYETNLAGSAAEKLAQHRFLFKILLKSIDFERRGRSEPAAGSGWD